MIPHKTKGFSLVELITVLVLIAIIGSVAVSALVPSASLQMQSSRDLIVAAFFSAQQKAMAQLTPVRVICTSNSVDVRMDVNGDNTFGVDESIAMGGVQYPVALISGQTLSAGVFDFDRLGRTSAATLTLSQSGSTVSIAISENGAIN